MSHTVSEISVGMDTIQTQEFTNCTRRYLKNLVKSNVPVMFLGPKGIGKTTLIMTFLEKYVPDALRLNGNSSL